MLMFAFFHIFKLKEFDLEAHLVKRKQLICLLEFNKKSYVLCLNLSIYLQFPQQCIDQKSDQGKSRAICFQRLRNSKFLKYR